MAASTRLMARGTPPPSREVDLAARGPTQGLRMAAVDLAIHNGAIMELATPLAPRDLALPWPTKKPSDGSG